MKCNIGNVMADIPQFRNWLKDRGGKDNKMSGWIWEVIEDKANKIRMVGEEEKGTKDRKSVENQL